MKFDLVDRVLEASPDRIVTLKHVSSAEEYLQDHFPSFPVLPGVMMLESLVQAARRMVEPRCEPAQRVVLGQVRALKYGAFVRPGSTLRIEVDLLSHDPAAGTWDCKGTATLIDPQAAPGQSQTAVSGRFMLRPLRVHQPA
jgi:3-hydroxyacyl-[acyl-carrier-protein] dehydratase